MNPELIEQQLLSLPAEIAASATSVLNLQVNKTTLEADIKEIELTETDSIWGNTAYTNEGKRKSVLKSTLSGNEIYKAKVKDLKDTSYQLELARINHQKLRDTLSVYLALAGVR